MNTRISLGQFEISIVSGGRLWIDGGNMFGVIPRVLWEQKSTPDAQNRILLETNCVLVRTRQSIGLIDTGYGSKATEKFRQRYALAEVAPLLSNLAAHGVSPDEVNWVILTHLHFDHAGGCTIRSGGGKAIPTFPNARHFIQKDEWEDAAGDLPELAGSYFREDFLPLEEAGLVEIVDGSATIAPGISLQRTGGHTRGHQIVRLDSGGISAVCPADLCPTAAHLPTFWTMAYDQFPLDVRRVKPDLIKDIAQNYSVCLFSHEPHIPAARLRQDASGNWIARDV